MTDEKQGSEPSPEHNSELSPEEQLKVWGRRQRPLPKTGCSIAFFIFLALLILYLVIKFIQYKNQ